MAVGLDRHSIESAADEDEDEAASDDPWPPLRKADAFASLSNPWNAGPIGSTPDTGEPRVAFQVGEPMPAVALGASVVDLTTLEHAEIGPTALPIHHAAGHSRDGETANAQDPVSQKSAIAEIVARAPRSTSDLR